LALALRGEDVPVVTDDDSAIPKPLMWDFCEQQADAPGNLPRLLPGNSQRSATGVAAS